MWFRAFTELAQVSKSAVSKALTLAMSCSCMDFILNLFEVVPKPLNGVEGAIDAVIFESFHVKLSVANFFDRTFW